MDRVVRFFFLSLFVIFFLLSCSDYEDASQKRAERAKNSKEITIAVVWPLSGLHRSMINGAVLAADEINERGGVLGKPLKLLFFDDSLSVDNALKSARKIVSNYDIVAVVGHRNSDNAIAASVTYEYNSVLFIATVATNPHLTNHQFHHVFRIILTDDLNGKLLAEFAAKKGFKNIVVIDDRSSYGIQLAHTFHKSADHLGIHIVTDRSYFPWQRDLRPMVDSIKKFDFDAVFLAASVPNVGLVVKQIREMGIDQPILGGDGLNHPKLLEVAGEAAEGIITISFFNPFEENEKTKVFMEKYLARYGEYPDHQGANGYEAINLLAYAFEKSKSTIPLIVASTIRYLENYESISGTYSFERNGDIRGKKLYFQTVKNGKFVFLEE